MKYTYISQTQVLFALLINVCVNSTDTFLVVRFLLYNAFTYIRTSINAFFPVRVGRTIERDLLLSLQISQASSSMILFLTNQIILHYNIRNTIYVLSRLQSTFMVSKELNFTLKAIIINSTISFSSWT